MTTIHEFDPNESLPPIKVEPKAREQLKKQSVGALGVRLLVKKTGCSGFKYEFALANTPEEGNIEFPLGDNVKFFVPRDFIKKYFPQGLTIDYIREGLNHKFSFANPVAVDLCGCGESFRVK